MDSLHDFANIIGRCVADQSMREGGKIRDGESRSMKKLSLTTSFRMVKGEEVAGKLDVLYDGGLDVRQAHDATSLCCLLHRAIFERTGRSPALVCSKRTCRLLLTSDYARRTLNQAAHRFSRATSILAWILPSVGAVPKPLRSSGKPMHPRILEGNRNTVLTADADGVAGASGFGS